MNTGAMMKPGIYITLNILHLAEMLMLANPPNSDLSRGFTVPQVAEKIKDKLLFEQVSDAIKKHPEEFP